MKRCLILIFICLICLVVPTSVTAQNDIELDSLQVSIFPEYDRPETLVIYRITMPADQTLPVDLAFHLPVGVASPFNVAMEDVDGLLYNLDYRVAVGDYGNVVSFTSLAQKIQIEYYDSHLEQREDEKEFDYQWTGDYAVNHMSIQAQQPATAGRFQIIPDMGETSVGEDHLTYYQMEVGEVRAGTTFTVRLVYEKSDDILSINSQSVQPVQPITQSNISPLAIQNENTLPVVMGVLSFLIIVGALLWYQRSWKDRKKSNERRDAHSGDSSRNAEELIPIYCHSCGKKAKTGDVFCRACGSKLRY